MLNSCSWADFHFEMQREATKDGMVVSKSPLPAHMGVCLLPFLSSKRIRNGARDGPRNAMPELARSPPVGPRFCPVGPVVFPPTPRRGSPSHAWLVLQQGKKVPRKVSFRFFAFVAEGLLN